MNQVPALDETHSTTMLFPLTYNYLRLSSDVLVM